MSLVGFEIESFLTKLHQGKNVCIYIHSAASAAE